MISNRFAALEILSDSQDTNRASENNKENIKITAKESQDLYDLNQHKTWFNEKCLDFSDQRKQVKLQWVEDPNRSNVHNQNNVRGETSRHFRNKKKEYLKAEIDELVAHSKIESIRDRKEHQRL